jgi:hypothetical protein
VNYVDRNYTDDCSSFVFSRKLPVETSKKNDCNVVFDVKDDNMFTTAEIDKKIQRKFSTFARAGECRETLVL